MTPLKVRCTDGLGLRGRLLARSSGSVCLKSRTLLHLSYSMTLLRRLDTITSIWVVKRSCTSKQSIMLGTEKQEGGDYSPPSRYNYSKICEP